MNTPNTSNQTASKAQQILDSVSPNFCGLFPYEADAVLMNTLIEEHSPEQIAALEINDKYDPIAIEARGIAFRNWERRGQKPTQDRNALHQVVCAMTPSDQEVFIFYVLKLSDKTGEEFSGRVVMADIVCVATAEVSLLARAALLTLNLGKREEECSPTTS